MSTRRAAWACAAVLALPAVAACGPGGDDAPTAWSTNDSVSTNSGDQPEETQKSNDHLSKPSAPLQLTLPADSAQVPTSQWPQCDRILTAEQIKQLFVRETDDATLGSTTYGTLEGGETIERPMGCAWNFNGGRGSSYGGGDDLTVNVKVLGFGADAEVVQAYDKKRDELRGENNSENRFYRDGSYGTRRYLVQSDGTISTVVSDGEIAGWIQVQTTGSDDHYSSDVESATKGLGPAVAADLVPLLKRKH